MSWDEINDEINGEFNDIVPWTWMVNVDLNADTNMGYIIAARVALLQLEWGVGGINKRFR